MAPRAHQLRMYDLGNRANLTAYVTEAGEARIKYVTQCGDVLICACQESEAYVAEQVDRWFAQRATVPIVQRMLDSMVLDVRAGHRVEAQLAYIPIEPGNQA